MNEVYLGNPPEYIKRWILEHWDGSDSSDWSDSSDSKSEQPGSWSDSNSETPESGSDSSFSDSSD